jgi:hypothetical protein
MSMHLVAMLEAIRKQIADLDDRLSVVEQALLELAAKQEPRKPGRPRLEHA